MTESGLFNDVIGKRLNLWGLIDVTGSLDQWTPDSVASSDIDFHLFKVEFVSCSV